MERIQEVAREGLSNGDTLRITKFSRCYQIAILHIDDSPPELYINLSKKEAYTKWSEVVRHDVLEID